MTTATVTEALFAASPGVAQELADRSDRLTGWAPRLAASGRTLRGFVKSVHRTPILPIEALLEASVLVSMLDGHADRQPVESAWKGPFDASAFLRSWDS